MLLPRLPLQVALGVGVGGALVDVTDYARLPSGLSYRWGRTDGFYETEPSVFSFVLDNADGRFTPDNPLSPLASTLSEGVAVCVAVGGRLTGGSVRTIEPEFPGDGAAWASVRVSCDDMLGDASRVQLADLWDVVIDGAVFGASWPCDDDEGSLWARNVSAGAALQPYGDVRASFGRSARVTGSTSQLELACDEGAVGGLRLDRQQQFSALGSIAGEYFGVWLTPGNSQSSVTVSAFLNSPGNPLFTVGAGFGIRGTNYVVFDPASLSFVPIASAVEGEAAHLAVGRLGGDGLGNNLVGVYVNGVEVRRLLTGSATNSGGPDLIVQVGEVAGDSSSVTVSNLTFSDIRLPVESLFESTPSQRIAFLSQRSTRVTLDPLPADWSTVALVPIDQGRRSLLDALNEVVKAEQGYLYVSTSGTLTSPVSVVKFRARERPVAVSQSFDIEDELSGAPSFVRGVQNLVWQVRVGNGVREVPVTDVALADRARGASTSEDVPLALRFDLFTWGSDRIYRGANRRMQIGSVVVDALTTPSDRGADLLGLVPGDRVRFTGLPSVQLGFDEWDGWFLGADESHSIERNSFELFFAPALPGEAIFDTSRYVDEVLTLSAGVDAVVTSLSVATSGVQLTTSDLPLTVQVGAEFMTVTACTSAVPQVVTVVRGVNGSVAAAHLAGASVSVVPDSVYGF